MFHVDVERVDVVVTDAAADAAFFTARAPTVAAVVDNDGVKNDDFSKTIFLMFVVYVHFLNLF